MVSRFDCIREECFNPRTRGGCDIEMGMFSEITPEELPLRNMAVKKIQQLGFLDVETVVDTIAFLMNRPSILRKVTGKTPKESTEDE